jgi:RNA recognition motif-containing protein
MWADSRAQVFLSAKAATLIIRNLAFKSDEALIQRLFAPCGTVESVRMPRKPDGSTDGRTDGPTARQPDRC